MSFSLMLAALTVASPVAGQEGFGPATVLPRDVPEAGTAADARHRDLAAEVDGLVRRYHELRLFNGAVLVARDDSVLFERGYGDANMEWGIPNRPDTRFRIGSITKQFTAALVLRLAEDGLLDVQDPVSAYLPDYPKPQGDRVTLHHLLTHTSGIPSYTGFPDFGEEYARNPFSPDSLVAVFSGMELEFEPGTDWNYSNSGYFLLGYIIEQVTGEPYDRALRTRLLEPLGLDDTGYDHHAELIERRAAGYVRTPAGYENAAYLDTSLPYAAGSLYSTVRDLHHWTVALHGGRVFQDPASYQRMATPYRQNYGYGLVIGKIDPGTGADSVRFIGHGGGINGFISQLQYFPESGYTLALLDNTSSGDVATLAQGIGVLLHGGDPEPPEPPIADVVYRTVEQQGVEAARDRYRELRESSPKAYDFSEGQLNRLGYLYLDRGELEKAIAVFQLNVEAYPDAFNTYDSLGEAYMEAGRRELAIENYRKSLELNPANENAREMLRQMGVEVEMERVELAPEVLDRYVGSYRVELGPGFDIPFRRRGEVLEVRLPGASWMELIARSETRFILSDPPFRFEFDEKDDEVIGLTLTTPAGEKATGERVKEGS